MIIMIKTDKQLKVPKWSKNEINRWADYIELEQQEILIFFMGIYVRE